MNRRASDLFPITDRMTCPVLRWVDATKAATVRIACVCVYVTFMALLLALPFAGVRL